MFALFSVRTSWTNSWIVVVLTHRSNAIFWADYDKITSHHINQCWTGSSLCHLDNIMAWRHFPHTFLLLAWTSYWVNSRCVSDLKRHGAQVTSANNDTALTAFINVKYVDEVVISPKRRYLWRSLHSSFKDWGLSVTFCSSENYEHVNYSLFCLRGCIINKKKQ